MRVLALDSCLGAVSVALRWRTTAGDWRLCAASERRATGHAERLLPMIAEVMRAAGLGFAELDRIAVTRGPGTFTGVRTGIAAARALALATGRPVVGATSLAVIMHQAAEALAGARRGRPIAVAVDARRGEVYAQLFGDSARDCLAGPLALTPATALEELGRGEPIWVGSGAPLLEEAARARGQVIATALAGIEPEAAALAALAGDLEPLAAVRPIYLRAPDARPQPDRSLPRV